MRKEAQIRKAIKLMQENRDIFSPSYQNGKIYALKWVLNETEESIDDMVGVVSCH